jgi:uncharacterized protein
MVSPRIARPGRNDEHDMSQDHDEPQAAAAAAAPSPRTRIRRLAENARYDARTVRRIVDAAWMCHIAFTDDAGGVHCIPTACWRRADHVYVHGSNGSRMLKALQSGRDAVLTITHLDGLVLARSAFNHSMNYRSVVVYGRFETVPDAEKPAALAALMDHIAVGRQAQARPGDANELAATTVLRLSLAEAAAKVRTGPPDDDAGDLDRPVWAGVLPLELVARPPQADPACDAEAARHPPAHVAQWAARRFRAD